MKKLKILPLLFFALLCACLLTGCGKDKGETAETVEEDEMVYTASFTPVHWKDDFGLEPLAVTEDGFYASGYEKNPAGNPEYRQAIFFVDLSGEPRRLDYDFLPLPEDTEGRLDYCAGSNVNRLFVLPEGDLLVLESAFVSWNEESGQDPFRYESVNWIRRMSSEGAEISSAQMEWDGDPEEDYLDTYYAVADPQGRIWADGGEKVYVFDPDGSCTATIELDDWVNRLALLTDGRVGALIWGPNGQELVLLDAEKGSAGERISLGDEYPQEVYAGYGEYGLLFSSGTKLYGLNVQDQTVNELVDLMICDLTAEQLRYLAAGEDGSFIGLAGDYTQMNFVTLRQVPRSSLGERKVITLGTIYPDLVNDAVIRFNRQHPDIRIEIVDYSQYGEAYTEEDAINNLTKLTTEIMAGDMPDLLALDALPYEQLAAKGLLEDLYPWLDADEELSREDFFPTVLHATEVDGKLCQVSPGFSVMSLIGATDVVGERSGWTFDELEAALATMPEGCTPLDPTMDRNSILMMCLFVDMDSYIDWTNASCDFENEDFCKLLSFCSQFPADPDYDADVGTVTGRIAAGKQMLMETTVGDLDELDYNDQYFGGNCTYVGYPTRSGSGNVLMISDGYAMSRGCWNKAAAWEFLRTFLLPEYQRQQYSLPLRRDVMEEKIRDAMVCYETDEKGEYRLDEEGNRIPIARGGMGMSDEYGNIVQLELYGITEEQAARFLQVIETADRSVDMNFRIYAIVKEEAGAFFAGQKSAEEVAKLIQSKVSLYLGEQG